MRSLVLVAHNVRSAHNVGSLLRTAEGLAVTEVFLTGYTPYPLQASDNRLPHLAQKIDKQITKTALGAENLIAWQRDADINNVLTDLRSKGFAIAALEQAENAIKLLDFKPPAKLALIVGREVEGLEPEILAGCDHILEIPMFGQKESFNVAQAAAMVLYELRFHN